MDRSSNISNKYLALSLAIVILFAIGKTALTDPLEIALRTILTPVLEGTRLTRTQISNEWATFSQLRAQRTQLQALKEENTRLLSENSFLKILNQERKDWYATNKLAADQSFSYLPAVLVRSDGQLVLTLKSPAVIEPGSAVVYQNHLIGIVRSQSGQMLTAKPLTDLNLEIPVLIVGRDGVKGRGLLSQNYGTSIQVDRILQNIQVVKNDEVALLPSENFPDNIRIGYVDEVIKRESDVFQQVTIAQPVNISQILNVQIPMRQK